MQIEIQSYDFSLTDALRDHIERRLRFTLARVANRIRRITVQLFDINGPRGGIDKCCRIQVRLNGLDGVVIEDTEANVYLAIDRATGRIGRNLMRRLARYEARPDYYPTGLATVPVY